MVLLGSVVRNDVSVAVIPDTETKRFLLKGLLPKSFVFLAFGHESSR